MIGVRAVAMIGGTGRNRCVSIYGDGEVNRCP
jgi:hypothetical protein